MAMGSVGKRKAERRGCQVKAQVIRHGGGDPIDCMILDFSSTGARVKLNAPLELPARFKLYIPSRPETKNVLLRWMKGLEFGCEYSTGVADEKTFFELIDRVDKLERAGGAGGGADHSEALTQLAMRLEAVEAKLAADAPTASAGSSESDADALATLARRVDEAVKTAEGYARRDDGHLSNRIAEAEERLRAQLAPDAAARLARLEALVESGGLYPSPGGEAQSGAPDPLIVGRIADLEAKLMAMPRPAAAIDTSALDARIEEIARRAEERADRVERFLMTRIDDLESQMISAPAAPAPMRSSEIADLDLRLHELAARIDGLSQAPPPASIDAVAPDELARLIERMSDLEISVMELRIDQPSTPASAPAPEDMDLHRRILEIEGRHAEIIGTLRNLLALLSASEGRRAAG